MRNQAKMFQIKKQVKFQKATLMEVYDLPDREFKITIIRCSPYGQKNNS